MLTTKNNELKLNPPLQKRSAMPGFETSLLLRGEGFAARLVRKDSGEYNGYMESFLGSIHQGARANFKTHLEFGSRVFLFEITDPLLEKKFVNIVWSNDIPYGEMSRYLGPALEKASEKLALAFARADAFWPFPRAEIDSIKGIEVVNNDSAFSTARICLLPAGFRYEIKPLLDALITDNFDRARALEIHYAASVFHEFIHAHRDEVGFFCYPWHVEIVTQMGQLLFDPANNEIFNKLAKRCLEEIEKGDKKELHDKAMHALLTIFAKDMLSRDGALLKSGLLEDGSPHKCRALLAVIDSLQKLSEKERMNLLGKYLGKPHEELENRYSRAAKELNILPVA